VSCCDDRPARAYRLAAIAWLCQLVHVSPSPWLVAARRTRTSNRRHRRWRGSRLPRRQTRTGCTEHAL